MKQERILREKITPCIGHRAGFDAQTNYSVYIGSFAGWDEDTDQMLYIENSGDSTPLIGGSFNKNIVGINIPPSNLLSGATLQVDGDASKSTAGSWTANSDRRLKTNIQYMESEDMLQKMLALKEVTYEWKDTVTGITRPEGIQYGFIAQDLQKVWPSKISKDGQGYLVTFYGDYDPMFVESIKALYQIITELETEKQQLQDSLGQLQSSLNQAEKEREDIQSEMNETKSEREELRNEIDDIKKRLRSLSVQQIQAPK